MEKLVGGTGGDQISGLSTLQMSVTAAWLPQQLPPLSEFSGNDRAEIGETFEMWLEQIELVVSTEVGQANQTGPSRD